MTRQLEITQESTSFAEETGKRKRVNLPDGFYRIESGVSIPEGKRLTYIDGRYAFLKNLPVSDTKSPQCVRIDDPKVYMSVMNCANNYGSKTGKVFLGKPVIDGGKTLGFRIWRIK